MKKQVNKLASVRDEQMDTESNINVPSLKIKNMEKLIQPTVFVDEKTKTRPEVVVLGTLEMWGYRPPYDDSWPMTHDGRPVKRPGSLYFDDHKWHFKPYSLTGAPRYDNLLLRQYSKLRRTLKKLQLMIYIPLLLPPWLAERVMRDEFEKQIQFLKKHVWNKKSGKEAA